MHDKRTRFIFIVLLFNLALPVIDKWDTLATLGVFAIFVFSWWRDNWT